MKKKGTELKDLTVAELQDKLQDERSGLTKLRFAHTVSPVESPVQLRTNGAVERNLRKERVGIVTSDKMNKSVVVTVERRVMHPKYGKFVKLSSTFMAHDEKDEAHVGDTVRISETRPISKQKRWRLVEVIERAK